MPPPLPPTALTPKFEPKSGVHCHWQLASSHEFLAERLCATRMCVWGLGGDAQGFLEPFLVFWISMCVPQSRFKNAEFQFHDSAIFFSLFATRARCIARPVLSAAAAPTLQNNFLALSAIKVIEHNVEGLDRWWKWFMDGWTRQERTEKIRKDLPRTIRFLRAVLFLRRS